MTERDDWIERVNRTIRHSSYVRVGVLLVFGLLFFVLQSDDPDKYGWWLVSGVVLVGLVAFLLLFRQRPR